MGLRGRQPKRGKLAIIAGVLAVAVLALWFTLTSPAPLLPERAAPTAQQVGAGRDAYRQLRMARGNKAGASVTLGQAQLDGLSAVASHGFRPHRLALSTEGRQLVVAASRQLPLGRWLNITIRVEGPSKGFPITRLKIGLWSLPPWLSHWSLQAGRFVLGWRVAVPPLDVMVRNFSVEDGRASALISLPRKAGLVDQMAGAVAQTIDKGSVVRIYCSLTSQHRQRPSGDFAEQVRRAFALDPDSVARTDFNRAAFVALAMLLVDERAGDFAHLSPNDLRPCRVPVVATSIYGRHDWPKHWTLSAAIAVGAGTQLSEAAGEWKELADSLAKQSQFAIGDPTGFSMADLAADRAGFRVANAASQPDSADRVAAALARAGPEQLLPHQLIETEDSLSNAIFVQRYGGIDDPRFKARVRDIDTVVDRSGLR